MFSIKQLQAMVMVGGILVASWSYATEAVKGTTKPTSVLAENDPKEDKIVAPSA